jgi:acyl-CoA thioesterase
MKSPVDIVTSMYQNDVFSVSLGIKIEHVDLGEVKLSLPIKIEHTNGFKIAHGGICYALADTCLAFVANTYGFKAVSVETSISHVAMVNVNDTLTAHSNLVHKGKSSAVYTVDVKNQENNLVAHFKGTVRISKEMW